MKNLRTALLMGAVLPTTTHAACTKAQVEWLESMGYSVDRAMAWCGKDASPQPVKAEPPRERPAPLPVVERQEPPRVQKTSELSEAVKYAQLIGNSNRVDVAEDGNAGGDSKKKKNEPPIFKDATATTTGGTTTNTGGRTNFEDGTTTILGGTTVTQGGTTTITEGTGKPTPENAQTTLGDFSTKKGNGSALVTAHIATGFAPMFKDKTNWPSILKAVSLDISAAIPAQTTTLKDYGKQAVMTLDGGIVNILASLPGIDHQSEVQNTSPRNFDRYYWAANGNLAQLLAYTKGGFGGRAIKTALQGDNGYAGLATAYLGMGVDGPLLSSREGKVNDPTAGWVSLEAFAVANGGNKTTFQKLFGGTPTRSVVPSWAANFSVTLPGKFYLTVGYYRAIGSYGTSQIGGTTVLAFGYNGGPEAKQKEQKGQEERELFAPQPASRVRPP